MKYLICLLAIAASTLADECMDQAKAMKQCVDDKIAEDRKEQEPVLKSFMKEAFQCLQIDGVKDVCKLPMGMAGHGLPPPTAGARPAVGGPHGNFSLPQELLDCVHGVTDNAAKCLTAAFPDAPQPMKFGPPPPSTPMQAGFFHPNPHQMHAMLDLFCNHSKSAVLTLAKCVFEAVNKTNAAHAIASVIHPEIARCKAASSCQQTSPISEECKQKFAKVRASICECQKQTVSFFQSDANCLAAKDKMPPPPAEGPHSPAQPNHDAAADHHGLPPHAGMDFCQEKSICERLEEASEKYHGQLNEAHRNYEAAPPASRR